MRSEPEEPRDCCFDEWARYSARRARRHETSARITAALVGALEEAGIQGRTLLDVGCGSGDLALAALARGAGHATGFDLGPGAIREARSLAAERGLSERVRFEVGDGAAIPLPRADVVSLNRVLCCYPDVESLLANTLGAAGTIYGFTAPHDRGVMGLWNRSSIRIGNAWYRLRARKYGGFRAFVHDLRAIDDRIRAAGFRPLRSERRGSWELAVYRRG
jgi:SAM-dependent methyltransferase